MALGDFMERCEAYFVVNGCIVDQPFQPRLPDGMVRCYVGADKVVGFGHVASESKFGWKHEYLACTGPPKKWAPSQN
jgi:hypothetical protein